MNMEVRELKRERLESRPLGNNVEAADYVRDNVTNAILPVFRTWESAEKRPANLEAIVGGERSTIGARLRRYFVEDVNGLPAALRYRFSSMLNQRAQTPNQKAYVRSVERMSGVNPYFASMLNVLPAETSEFLYAMFERLSNETWNAIPEVGAYRACIQVGTGPNGDSVFSELTRQRPDLAANTLVVDSGAQPGGAFALVQGFGWLLNSANSFNRNGRTLPTVRDIDNEMRGAAGYSPATWTPGQRGVDENGDDEVLRRGSINNTSPHGVQVDDFSGGRFPTNEFLQMAIASHFAAQARMVAMKTEVIAVEENDDPSKPGKGIVTLRRVFPDGRAQEKRVYTDLLLYGSGFGEPSYGFEYKGSVAEEEGLAEKKTSGGFPVCTTTLGALEALNTTRGDPSRAPKRIILSGAGDSSAILVERLTQLIDTVNSTKDSQIVTEIEEIIVVASRDSFSPRSRYKALLEVLTQKAADKKKIVRFVEGRVGDVMCSQNSEGNIRKDENGNVEIFLLDEDGLLLTDENGSPVSGDSYISNAGFTPNNDTVFKKLLEPGTSIDDENLESALDPVTIRSNKSVKVGSRLRGTKFPVFIYGVADDPEFDDEKLASLDPDTRAVVENNPENIVAMGIRGQEAAALVDTILKRFAFGALPIPPSKNLISTKAVVESGVEAGTQGEVVQVRTQMPIGNSLTAIQEIKKHNNIDVPLYLSAVLASSLGSVRCEPGFSGTFSFLIKRNTGALFDGVKFPLALDVLGGISPQKNGRPPLFLRGAPEQLVSRLVNLFSEPRTMKHIATGIVVRRVQDYKVEVTFVNGKLSPTKTRVTV